MLSPSTVKVAKQMATSLSEANRIAVAKESTPVGIMAEHYHVGAPALKRNLSHDGYRYLTAQFAKRNTPQGGDVVDPGSEQRDQLVELIASGVKGMLFKVRQGILPLCKKIHPEYVSQMKTSALPDIKVTAINYHSIHENDVLISHIADYPRKYKRETAYRSFILDLPDSSKLFDWLPKAATLADDVIRPWMLEKISDVDLQDVWSGLFDRREVNPSEIHFTQRGMMPYNADQILAAYLLTSYLRDNPIDETPQGEQVSLEEWTKVMTGLHAMMAFKLIELYEKRQQDRKLGKLVYRYKQSEHGLTGNGVHVDTNGDLFPDWIDQGGDVQALLGAATHHANMVYIKPINEAHDNLVKLWKRKHGIIKARAVNNRAKWQRNYLETTLLNGDRSGDNLPQFSSEEFDTRVRSAMRHISEEDLENDWRAIIKLVCQVYYPESQYYNFLCAMERYGVGIDSREAATLAAVEITAQWLAQQTVLSTFTPLVVSQPEAPAVAETEDASAHA